MMPSIDVALADYSCDTSSAMAKIDGSKRNQDNRIDTAAWVCDVVWFHDIETDEEAYSDVASSEVESDTTSEAEVDGASSGIEDDAISEAETGD